MQMHLRKFFFLAFCSLLCLLCSAQKTIDVSKSEGVPQNVFFSVGGEPFINVKFVRLVEGTPYFKDEWMKGQAVSATGIRYKAGILKLDLFNNQVHYLDAEGKEMIATLPLKEIFLTDTVTEQNWHFIHSSLFPVAAIKQGWYLKLATGKVGLYQYFSKSLSERTPYGSATTEQLISTKHEFYLYSNGSLKQVKKAKDIIELLHDRQKELEEHLKNISNGKSLVAQLTSIVDFYNQE